VTPWPPSEDAPPRWSELPPGVLRAFGWYARNTIDAMCAQAEKGRVPWPPYAKEKP
jgi:hypothetical protein